MQCELLTKVCSSPVLDLCPGQPSQTHLFDWGRAYARYDPSIPTMHMFLAQEYCSIHFDGVLPMPKGPEAMLDWLLAQENYLHHSPEKFLLLGLTRFAGGAFPYCDNEECDDKDFRWLDGIQYKYKHVSYALGLVRLESYLAGSPYHDLCSYNLDSGCNYMYDHARPNKRFLCQTNCASKWTV